jgi:hypothetical protein
MHGRGSRRLPRQWNHRTKNWKSADVSESSSEGTWNDESTWNHHGYADSKEPTWDEFVQDDDNLIPILAVERGRESNRDGERVNRGVVRVLDEEDVKKYRPYFDNSYHYNKPDIEGEDGEEDGVPEERGHDFETENHIGESAHSDPNNAFAEVVRSMQKAQESLEKWRTEEEGRPGAPIVAGKEIFAEGPSIFGEWEGEEEEGGGGGDGYPTSANGDNDGEDFEDNRGRHVSQNKGHDDTDTHETAEPAERESIDGEDSEFTSTEPLPQEYECSFSGTSGKIVTYRDKIHRHRSKNHDHDGGKTDGNEESDDEDGDDNDYDYESRGSGEEVDASYDTHESYTSYDHFKEIETEYFRKYWEQKRIEGEADREKGGKEGEYDNTESGRKGKGNNPDGSKGKHLKESLPERKESPPERKESPPKNKGSPDQEEVIQVIQVNISAGPGGENEAAQGSRMTTVVLPFAVPHASGLHVTVTPDGKLIDWDSLVRLPFCSGV